MLGCKVLHDYQTQFLNRMNVQYKVQTDEFVSNQEILAFTEKFEHILIHFDIDVLDEKRFPLHLFCQPGVKWRWFRRR